MLSFSPLSFLGIGDYRNHLKNIGFSYRSCEYCYSNLFAWKDIYNTEFAETDGGYIFRMTYDGIHHYLTPVVDLKNSENAFLSVIGYESSDGSPFKFICMPKERADILSVITGRTSLSDRNNADYIYEYQKLASFSGKSLHSKKNHLNKFLSLYKGNYEYREMTADDATLCLDFNKKWYSINSDISDTEFLNERRSTEVLLENFDLLKLKGGLLFTDGTLSAYTIASDSYDGSDSLIIHTEKGLYDISGIYPAVCSMFLSGITDKYAYINKEDDLGDDGLRKSKLSYKPEYLEEKYVISL